MKRIVGIIILLGFFAGIMIMVSSDDGRWWYGPALFMGSTVVTAIILGAVYLICDEKEDKQ